MKRMLMAVVAAGMIAGCNDNLPVAPPPGWTTARLIGSHGDENGVQPVDIVTMAADLATSSVVVHGAVLFSEPRNGKMVFLQPTENPAETGIFVAGVDGSNPVQIAHYASPDEVGIYSIVLSNDGSKVSYAVRHTEQSSSTTTVTLYVANTDGSGIVTIDTDFSFDGQPAFSPDGTLIAYFKGQWTDGLGKLMMNNADGAGFPEQLMGDVEIGQDGGMTTSWSPDGRRILFTSNIQSDPPTITELDVQSKASTTLGLGALPVYSPDGSKIAFVGWGSNDAMREGATTDLFVMYADGTNRLRLTADSAFELYPSWSPDGRALACTACNGEPGKSTTLTQVAVVDLASGEIRKSAAEANNTYTKFFWVR